MNKDKRKLKDILEKTGNSSAVREGHILVGYARWVGGNLT